MVQSNFIPQFAPSFDEKEANALFDYMRSGGWATEFTQTRDLEKNIAEFTGAKHCVITNNGTISLTLALLAADIGPGDEVLVPDITMIATANSCKIFGAVPVFVDIDPTNLCLDLAGAAKSITPKTKALIYVSLHGRSGNMDLVREFCNKHSLFFLEDAAQSLGSYYNDIHLGRFGRVGSFSFSMPKIITTGQGGALITDDDILAEKIRLLKDFGRSKGGMDMHGSIGYNFKFTDIQATLGLVQITKLPARIKRKREIYALYSKLFKDVDGITMVQTNIDQTTPWFIDIYVEDPDNLAAYLKEQGIGSRRIYPPLHAQMAYSVASNCPNAEYAARRGLWLPSSVQLSDEQINMISNEVISYFKEKK